MTARAKITSRGRVTIPKDVRERLGLKPGDEIEFVEDREGFRLQKHVAVSILRKYRGQLKHLAGHDPDELVEQMRGR
jgi:AbrB family looped-hinge helix DNA binding protein